MKKNKWFYIISGILIVIVAAGYFLPRLLLNIAYSPQLGEKEVPLVENLPKATDTLEMKNGKYLLAFSELKSQSDSDTGAFYVIDETGRFYRKASSKIYQSQSV